MYNFWEYLKGYNLKNIYLILYITIISVISILLFTLNYQMSTNYCELLSISEKVSLTTLSFDISSEISMIITLVEILIINYIFNKIKYCLNLR